MGNSDTKEAQILRQVSELEGNPALWKPVVSEFLQEELTENFYKLTIDIKLLNILCDLLQHVEQQERKLIFRAIVKFLGNRTLYKQIATDFALELLFEEILQNPKADFCEGLEVLHSIVELKSDKPDEDAEADNKLAFAKTQGFEFLLDVLKKYEQQDEAQEILLKTLDIFRSFLITRQSTTTIQVLQICLQVFTQNFRFFLNFLHFPVDTCRFKASEIAIQLMYCLTSSKAQAGKEGRKVVLLEDQEERYRYMQQVALESGAILWQLKYAMIEDYGSTQSNGVPSAVLTPTSSSTSQASPDDQQRMLSRQLLRFFCDGSSNNIKLIKQMLPLQLFMFAVNTEAQSHSVAWEEMFTKMLQNHKTMSLIWNRQTRTELREQLTRELNRFENQKRVEQDSKLVWQQEDFYIEYYSLQQELRCGDIFINMFIEHYSNPNNQYKVSDPVLFMSQLYDALVIQDDKDWKKKILISKRLLFTNHLNSFTEYRHMPYIVWLLKEDHFDLYWQEELLLFLKQLFSHNENIKSFVAEGGIPRLIHHLSRIHFYRRAEEAMTSFTSQQLQETASKWILMSINILALLEATCWLLPRSRQLLSSNADFLQTIVQIIPIMDQKTVTNQAMILLGQILHDNRIQQPLIYKTGLFHFLMLQMKYGCSQMVAIFLRQYHHIQADLQAPIKSYLQYFLPKPLIGLLERNDDKGAELFCDAMNTQSTNAFLIWSSEHREKMVQHVTNELQHFMDQLISPSSKEIHYVYKTPKPLSYDDIERELCIKNIYVKRFLEIPEYDIPEPANFMQGLIEAMGYEQKVDHLEYILSAQIVLFQKLKHSTKEPAEIFIQYPGFPVLSQIANEELQHRRQPIVAKICQFYAAMFSLPDSISSFNKTKFVVEHNGFLKLEQVLKAFMDDMETSTFIFRALGGLTTVAELDQYMQKQTPQLILFICKTFINSRNLLSEKISNAAIEALQYLLTLLSRTQQPLIIQGFVDCLLSFVEVGVLTEHQEDRSELFSLQVSASSLALQLLLTLCKQSQQAGALLQRYLTPNLFAYLIRASTIEQFVEVSRSDIDTPTLIWNKKMRQELLEFIDKNRSAVASVNDMFAFPSMKHEISIDSIYLRPFNRDFEKAPQDLLTILAINPLDFVTSIFSSIYADFLKYQQQKQLEEVLEPLTIKITTVKHILSMVDLEKQYAVIQHFFAPSLRQEQYQKSRVFVELLPIALQSTSKELKMNLLLIYHGLLRYKLSQESFNKPTSTTLGSAYSLSEDLLLLPLCISIHKFLLYFEQLSQPQAEELDVCSKLLTAIAELCNVSHRYVTCIATQSHMLLTVISIMANSSHVLPIRQQSARILSACCLSDGNLKQVILQHLLMPKFDQYVTNAFESPELLLYYFDEDHDTPEIVWGKEMRADLVKFLSKATSSSQSMFTDYKTLEQYIQNDYERPALTKEMRVGNVFVKSFNKNPSYKLSQQPAQFLAQLFQTITARAAASTEMTASQVDLVSECWKAVFNLLSINSPKLVQQFSTSFNSLNLFFEQLSGCTSDVQKIILGILALLSKNEDLVEQYNINRKYILTLLNLLATCMGSNEDILLRILNLIKDLLVRSSGFVLTVKNSGATLYILLIMLKHAPSSKVQELCADIIITMANDEQCGAQIQKYLCWVLMTEKFMLKFESQPAEFVRFFLAAHETQTKVWNQSSREKLTAFLEKKIAALEQRNDEWSQKISQPASTLQSERLDINTLQQELLENVYNKK